MKAQIRQSGCFMDGNRAEGWIHLHWCELIECQNLGTLFCPLCSVLWMLCIYWMEFFLFFLKKPLIFVYFADSNLELLNVMVSSHRWYWAPWKFQWEDVILQNLWWRAVRTKQLHFYYNSDFIAGHKYSFIAYGWALCPGETSLSGTSNNLVAQPVIIVILVLCTNLLNKDFTLSQLVEFSRTNADSCVRESTSIKNDHLY